MDSPSQCVVGEALWDIYVRVSDSVDIENGYDVYHGYSDRNGDGYYDDSNNNGYYNKNESDGKGANTVRHITAIIMTIRQFLLVADDRAVYMLLTRVSRSFLALKNEKHYKNNEDNHDHKFLENLLCALPLRNLLEYYSQVNIINYDKNNDRNKEYKNDDDDKNNNHYFGGEIDKNVILSLLQSLIEYACQCLPVVPDKKDRKKIKVVYLCIYIYITYLCTFMYLQNMFISICVLVSIRCSR